jgi:hypothetical protein
VRYSEPVRPEIERFDRIDHGWVRWDRWPDDGTIEHLHAAHGNDLSDPWLLSQNNHTGYDARCGWCYLGAPHTINAHNWKVSR